VGLPLRDRKSATLLLNGQKVEAHLEGSFLFLNEVKPGTHLLALK
jgi:hypothetical protein